MLSRRHLLCGLGGLAATAALPGAAQAAFSGMHPLPGSTEMAAGEFIPAPPAWMELLSAHPELDPGDAPMKAMNLTVARAAELIKVNKEVNGALRYRDDPESDLWQVGDREGDCEDFAIRKLATLIQDYDIPRSALTLSACRLEGRGGHAVLLVHSDRGVYVMDNLSPRVHPWRKLPYRWLAREEPGAPFRLWRSLQV